MANRLSNRFPAIFLPLPTNDVQKCASSARSSVSPMWAIGNDDPLHLSLPFLVQSQVRLGRIKVAPALNVLNARAPRPDCVFNFRISRGGFSRIATIVARMKRDAGVPISVQGPEKRGEI